MLNQSNKYFNRFLTYLDQGGNNIWWSTNSTSNTRAIAELIVNGLGTSPDCIETDCIPICSDVVESEQQSIEQIDKSQSLIYPDFIVEDNRITIRLNNLFLVSQPNYIEDGCIDSDCVEEFGIWTKAIKTRISVDIDNEIYYFIKANPDNYGFAYIYNISLIHEETGEEIVITSNKGILDSTITTEFSVPDGFNIALSITKFNIEEIITTYKFINKPLYLRSNFNLNLPWQPLYNNIEEVLLSIIYILNTDLEIEDKDKLVLYKKQQETLINTLISTVISISNDNSYNYSYIKNKTEPVLFSKLVTNNNEQLEDIIINPAIYETTEYIKEEENTLIVFLVLIVLSITNYDTDLINTYITKAIDLKTNTLKEDVFKLISLVEAYKTTEDIYVLSIATSTLNQINKRYLLDDGSYIESLNNPTISIDSKIYGDLLNYYVYNKEPNEFEYILNRIEYINNIDLYVLNSPYTITSNYIQILILRLIGINIKITTQDNNLIKDTLNINLTTTLKSNLLEPLELYKQEVFNTFKESIPIDFGWLSSKTPIQDLIIECSIKPLLDLYIHTRYIKDKKLFKDALTKIYTGIVTNKEELLSYTLATDVISVNKALWPGKYSNSIDLEINGYYNEDTKPLIEDIKTLGIETNLISSIDLPNIDSFDLCINIVKLEDFRCQVDINGQLILLDDGQCNLAPTLPSILLQETGDPITQETSIQDYILI